MKTYFALGAQFLEPNVTARSHASSSYPILSYTVICPYIFALLLRTVLNWTVLPPVSRLTAAAMSIDSLSTLTMTLDCIGHHSKIGSGAWPRPLSPLA